MIPYILGIIVLLIFGKEHHGADYKSSTDIQFRLLLAFGAIPAAIVMYLSYYEVDSAEYVDAKMRNKSTMAEGLLESAVARGYDDEDAAPPKTPNPFMVAFKHPEKRLFYKLIGTGFGWFIYDILFYGTCIDQVDIMNSVFPGSDLFSLCWKTLAINVFGLPGVMMAIWLLPKIGAKRLQVYGFACIIVFAGIFAVTFQYVTGPSKDWVNFVSFGLLIFSLNWGVNVSTYVLPTEAYPAEVRSSFFGVSAAMGKVGAILGAAVFSPLKAAVGVPWLMAVCALLALLGIAVTHVFVEPFGTASRSRRAETAALPNGEADYSPKRSVF